MSGNYSEYLLGEIPVDLAGELPGELPGNFFSDLPGGILEDLSRSFTGNLTENVSLKATQLNTFPQQSVSPIVKNNMTTCVFPMPAPLDPKDRPAAEGHGSAYIDAATSPSPVPTKAQKRTSFKEPQSLPDEHGLLDQDEILKLIYYTPAIRKKYPSCFSSTGHIRAEWYPLLFERTADGELKHPESILASNTQNWHAKLRTYECTDQPPRASKSTSPPSTQRQPLKRSASQTEKRHSKRTAKNPKPTVEEEPLARMEEPENLSVMPTVASPSENADQSNDTPALPPISRFFGETATAHGHPQIPQPIPSVNYDTMQPGFATSQTYPSTYPSPARLGNLAGNPSFAGNTEPNFYHNLAQIEFLERDWIPPFLRWMESRVQRLHMAIVEANDLGQSHEYQTNLAQLVAALYQLRMACLELDSFLRAETMIQ
ncbi:hypothetical protein N7478_003126 [Penicillium angulare]|uniref:uncharacterized protein n=1 Tax=Penicillium angulare TaxID=116970 RepID=UPI00254158D7|nr:uncharacterized protein N7478_003126 [Penicillium angulare]KAJ5287440.1 hypothetical protein N7478_003126 [Penicillium angulare]